LSKTRKAISKFTLAALLILSAAICAVGQSNAAGKSNSRDGQPAAPAKQNARQAPPDSKRNTREGQPSSQPAASHDAATASSPVSADAPRYFYEFRQPDFLVSHIQLEHDASGRGHVSFERKGSDETITEAFTLSEAALGRIRALWESLRFLDSEKSYQSERQYPHLGTVRLRLKQGTRDRTAEFNWTNDRDAFALADEYRRIAEQAMLLFNISVALENDPLNTPKLMDQLEALLKRNGLSDPQQLLPLLTDLTTDERIPLIARNHAGRLIKQIRK
jgi:hypothetical protein